MIGLWMECTDTLFAIPIAFDLETMLVQPTATITVTHVIRVIILKCLPGHTAIPPSNYAILAN